jgi:hypothetical protein
MNNIIMIAIIDISVFLCLCHWNGVCYNGSTGNITEYHAAVKVAFGVEH